MGIKKEEKKNNYHYKKLKDVYKKTAMKGVAMYANAVILPWAVFFTPHRSKLKIKTLSLKFINPLLQGKFLSAF